MKILRRILAYAGPYRKPLVLSMVAMILLVGVELATPLVVRRLIEGVTEPVWDTEAAQLVTFLAVGLLVLYTLRAGLSFVRSYASHVAGWGVVADARRHVYTHLQRLSLRFYENQQTGQLMSRMVNDTDHFERLISHAVPDTVVNLLSLIGVSAVLLAINWQLMLLTLVPIPLIVMAMQGFAKLVRPAFRYRQKELGELNAILADNLSGIREIKAFTREDSEATRISTRIENYKNSLLKALRLMATFGPSVEWSASLGTVIVIYFGGRLAFQQVLSIADMVAFLLYLEMFYRPVRVLSTAWEGVQESLASADRVMELLDQDVDVDDLPGARDLPEPVSGHIRLEGVSFHYIPGDPVLERIDLDAPPSSMVALVGPTGVGKTTLASLIPRFYDVCEGSIKIDGHDVRDVTLRSLRGNISMVLQDVFLFHGTVRENILFGRPGASEAEMIEAAKVANAHDFIMELPDDYSTLIGERGVKLSGGQKQRLSIARAVLKDAPILILDEATSSVDTETELLIQEALERLMVGRTTLVIAHRLSTIRNADMIVVLQGTGISETGSHGELMANGGQYRRLIEAQSRLAVA